MLRKIIKIDEEKCVGCGLCANACHEGAIGMVNGKAKLLSDDYCDGLGNCLPACPVNAISVEEREAVPFNKEVAPKRVTQITEKIENVTELRQWPVQIKLVDVNANFFTGADLLIAADCSAYAYGNFHNDFMKNKITLIGCPKLDDGSYSVKLTEILQNNDIRSVTVVRMEVPCCSGLENEMKKALKNCDKLIPWQVVTITLDGGISKEKSTFLG